MIELYALGTTYPPTPIDTLLQTTPLTGSRLPLATPYEAAEVVENLDATLTYVGPGRVVWRFGVLTQAMLIALRSVCPGASSAVYLRTRRPVDGYFEDYTAVMRWPLAIEDTRQLGTRYVNVEIEFVRLQEMTPQLVFINPDKSALYPLLF